MPRWLSIILYPTRVHRIIVNYSAVLMRDSVSYCLGPMLPQKLIFNVQSYVPSLEHGLELFQFLWTGTDPGRLGREGTGFVLINALK